MEQFNVQVIQSLEAMSLALPDLAVKPGETWRHDLNQSVRLQRSLTENARYEVTYCFDGVRNRDGRDEAVIEFEGTVARGEGDAGPVLPDAVDPNAKAGGKEKRAEHDGAFQLADMLSNTPSRLRVNRVACLMRGT